MRHQPDYKPLSHQIPQKMVQIRLKWQLILMRKMALTFE
jgi:hypothetical protein